MEDMVEVSCFIGFNQSIKKGPECTDKRGLGVTRVSTSTGTGEGGAP